MTADEVLVAQVFAPVVNYPVGLRPYDLVSADLDDDGDSDLVTGATVGGEVRDGIDTVCILMNLGDGTFASPVKYSLGDAPCFVAADLDNDDDIDLATSDIETNKIYILSNDGAGAFMIADTFASGGINPHKLIAMDLDGDGDFDLAVPNSDFGNPSDSLSLFFNNGDATFKGPVFYATGNNPITVISADLDLDGDSDLVVTNNGSGSVSVMLNDSIGVFPSRADYLVGQFPQSPSLADYDGDGCEDLAVPNAAPSTPFVSILFGNCDGTFDPKVDYLGCRPHTVASADFDVDGDIDMAVTNNECNSVSIFLNNGDGTFAPHFILPAGIGTQDIVAEDFDDDGDIDLAASNFDNDGTPGTNISVFINQTVTSVPGESDFPQTYVLQQNHPNPFNPTTEIRFQTSETRHVTLKIYDLLGQEVVTLVDERMDPGHHVVQWDARGAASGVYLYRMEAGNFTGTRKLVLVR
jgi:hypothetical protein